MSQPKMLAVALLALAELIVQTSSKSPVQAPSSSVRETGETSAVRSFLYVSDFDWSKRVLSAISAGPNAVDLTKVGGCPRGVSGSDSYKNGYPHWLYLKSADGDKNPSEPVAITGGTCTSGAAVGTIAFTSVFAHATGYTIGSSTGGAQEAESYARSLRGQEVTTKTFRIVFPMGTTTQFLAPLFISQGYVVLEGDGAIRCSVHANCIQIGDTWQRELLNGTRGNALGGYSTIIRDLSVGPGVRPWVVRPTSPDVIRAGSTAATLTLSSCPAGFYAAIPNQFLWLNGTTNGLEGTYRGTGERVRVIGGSCKGYGSGTIEIAPAEPFVAELSGHDPGYSLSAGWNMAFEDNGQGMLFDSVKTADWDGKSRFGGVFQFDNDQSAVIRDFSVTVAYISGATSEFQGALVFAPGPFSQYAAIVSIEHSNLSLQCGGNAIEWYSGNKVDLTDVIIQGWDTFGSKLSSVRGGYGATANYKDVYSERGNCANPINKNLSAPDMISNGYSVVRNGPAQPSNQNNLFIHMPGEVYQTWYVIYRFADNKRTVPIPIGFGTVNNPNSTAVSVYWNTGSGLGTPVTGYDLLRVSGTPGRLPNAPSGVGKYAVVTELRPSSTCDINGACKFVDNIATDRLKDYTIYEYNGGGNPTAIAALPHYGGGGATILTGAKNSIGADPGNGYPTYVGTYNCLITPVHVGEQVAFFTETTSLDIGAGYNNCLASGKGQYFAFKMTNAASNPQPGTIMLDDPTFAGSFNANGSNGLTGRLNFGKSVDNSSHDQITIWDSAPDQTEAVISPTTRNRRAILPADIGIGVDNQGGYASGGLMNHAGVSISNYVNVIPNGTNFQERLTASMKAFTVPITTNSQIRSTVTKLPPFMVASTTPVANLTTTPVTYDANGAQKTNVHLVLDVAKLDSGIARVTLTGNAAFSSPSSYACNVVRSANTHEVRVENLSGKSFTITSADQTDRDIVKFSCIGE
jgi:hypothetical protein